MNRPFEEHSAAVGRGGRSALNLGACLIDPVSREARWPGGCERLQPQTLKVLFALAAKRGEVVTRDELIQSCWDGRVVGEDVINRCVSLLRHLAERSGGFAIETVPRAGYRLIEHCRSGRSRSRWLASLAIVAATVTEIAVLRPAPPHPAPALKIAVQSFAAPRDNPDLRGIAVAAEDSVVRMLAESGIAVEVVKAGHEPETKPDFVLTGTVSTDAQRSVVNLRLDDPTRHAIVLSRRIDSGTGDPTALPDRAGATIAAALSWIAPMLRLERLHPSDPVFLADFLHTNETNFDGQRSFEFLRRNAPHSPDSALAQFSFARASGMNIMEVPPAERAEVLRAGRAAAARALRIAPDYGDAYIPWCLLHAEVRLAECETSLRRGMRIDPAAPFAGSVLAHLLHNTGRIEEGVSIANEVLAKDAYVPGKIASLLMLLEASGRSREAELLFQSGHRLWPLYPHLVLKRAAGLIARGDFEALDKFERSLGPNERPEGYEALGGLAVASRTRDLRAARAECPLTAEPQRQVECMILLSQLGDLDRAYQFASELYPRRTGHNAIDEDRLWLANPDNFDTMFITGSGAVGMRRDPRYLRLSERLGLVRYWQSVAMPDFCSGPSEEVCNRLRADG